MPSPVFFAPAGAWVGDVIPVESGGELLLYYLYEQRASPKPGTPWHLVATRDFVTFDDRGLALAPGGPDDEDFNAYTGSIVHDHAGRLHLFYTGQNPARLGPDGLPLQLVCHATSHDDGATWVKHPEWTFGAAPGYETADWRDPFVFFDEAAGVWRMLLAARHASGPRRRRGVIAQCLSDDLIRWRPAAPFWDPRRYITHECPDVFRWGEWWYLVYSEFSENFQTRYRMAKTSGGPWVVPEHDSVCSRAFYAARSVARGGRRFLVGWIATKAGASDDGDWEWAGTMAALEARQNQDGTLAFSLPDELVESFDEPVPLSTDGLLGTLTVPDGYAARLTSDSTPSAFYAAAELDIRPGASECGLLVHASPDGDEGYYIRLEPRRNRLVFDRWPRRRAGDAQWHVSGDVPFEIQLERPCRLEPGAHTLEVIVDGDALIAVLDRRVALSARAYRAGGRLGVFAGEGTVTVRRLELRRRTDIHSLAMAMTIQSMEMETQ